MNRFWLDHSPDITLHCLQLFSVLYPTYPTVLLAELIYICLFIYLFIYLFICALHIIECTHSHGSLYNSDLSCSKPFSLPSISIQPVKTPPKCLASPAAR